MKQVALILAMALSALCAVCLLAGLSLISTAVYVIGGGTIGLPLAVIAKRKAEEKQAEARHPMLFLLVIQVLIVSVALIGMILVNQVLMSFGSSHAGFTLLLWPVAVLVALLVATTSAGGSLRGARRRVVAYGMAIAVFLLHTYWHVFYLINKHGT